VSRRSSSEPLEVGEPDLDERPDCFLESGLDGGRERLLVALTRLFGSCALLQPVVTCHQKLLDSLMSVSRALHKRSLTREIVVSPSVEAAAPALSPIRVLIADDHRLFAEALEAILAADERIEVVGHAGDGREAVDLATYLEPDVILMDISMPVMDGIEAAKKILAAREASCVLMLTGSNSRSDVDRARQAGAAGYVTKDRIAAELIDAIIEVSSR
jgi:CheY-like chemotaxis protein